MKYLFLLLPLLISCSFQSKPKYHYKDIVVFNPPWFYYNKLCEFSGEIIDYFEPEYLIYSSCIDKNKITLNSKVFWIKESDIIRVLP